jgi:hypothetical protein
MSTTNCNTLAKRAKINLKSTFDETKTGKIYHFYLLLHPCFFSHSTFGVHYSSVIPQLIDKVVPMANGSGYSS